MDCNVGEFVEADVFFCVNTCIFIDFNARNCFCGTVACEDEGIGGNAGEHDKNVFSGLNKVCNAQAISRKAWAEVGLFDMQVHNDAVLFMGCFFCFFTGKICIFL